MTRRRVCVALALLLALAPRVSAQIVAGQLPQLPAELGPNGGLKVECIAGTCTGGGGVGADVNITAVGGNALTTAVPVSGTVAATNANLDIALSALRDAIVGAGPKTLSDIVTALGLLATTAKQDTGNTSLSSIDGKTPALGQALAAGSVPVILPALTVTALTPPAAITGFALEAGHLAAIDTSTAKIPSQGQAVAAASLPVVLPAAQVTALTPPAALTNYALETGGNLAVLAAAVDTLGTTAPTSVVLMGAVDGVGNTASLTAPQGVLAVGVMPRGAAGLRLPCNALRRTNCQ